MKDKINTQWFIEEYGEITESMIQSLREFQRKFDKRIFEIGKIFLDEFYTEPYDILEAQIKYNEINVYRDVKVIFNVGFKDGMIVEDTFTFPVKYYYLDDDGVKAACKMYIRHHSGRD
jgi:hypothetical protein